MTSQTPPSFPTHGIAHRYVIPALKGIGLFILLALLVHISWNMFAPDMFGVAKIHFKQALGLIVFSAGMAFTLRFASSNRSHRNSARNHT